MKTTNYTKYGSTINVLLALLLLFASSVYANDADFFVIPVVKEVEVCNGTPVGNPAFALAIKSPFDSLSLKLGSVYATEAGYLVRITGIFSSFIYPDINRLNVYYREGNPFRPSPNTLPSPNYGTKGPFYYLNEGSIAYAKYL